MSSTHKYVYPSISFDILTAVDVGRRLALIVIYVLVDFCGFLYQCRRFDDLPVHVRGKQKYIQWCKEMIVRV